MGNSWVFVGIRVKKKKKKWIFDVPSVAFDVVLMEFDSNSSAHYSNLPVPYSNWAAHYSIIRGAQSRWRD